jgi:hypothetical protein
MKRIGLGLLSLTLIVPYIFCCYCLTMTIWGALLIASNLFELILTIPLAIFLFYIMVMSGYLIISDAYISIKNEQ